MLNLIYSNHFTAIKWKIPSIPWQIPARHKCTPREECGINYLLFCFRFWRISRMLFDLVGFPSVCWCGNLWFACSLSRAAAVSGNNRRLMCGGRPGARALRLHSLPRSLFQERRKKRPLSRDAHFVCDRFGRWAKGADDVFKTLSRVNTVVLTSSTQPHN